MSDLTIELGERLEVDRCSCCKTPFRGGRGYVFRRGDACAAYWVNLYERHPDRRAMLLMALDADGGRDEWQPGPSFLIAIWFEPDRIAFGLQDPTISPWRLKPSVTGQTLNAAEARAHPALTEVWEIMDFIQQADPALNRHFSDEASALPPVAQSRRSAVSFLRTVRRQIQKRLSRGDELPDGRDLLG